MSADIGAIGAAGVTTIGTLATVGVVGNLANNVVRSTRGIGRKGTRTRSYGMGKVKSGKRSKKGYSVWNY